MSQEFLEQLDKEAQSIISAEFSQPIEIESVTTGEEDFSGNCIFDKTYEEIDPDTGAKTIIHKPRATISKIDVEDFTLEELQVCIINSVRYLIKNIEEDAGSGLILLHIKIE